MEAYGLYTVYLHHDVLRAVVMREPDAKLLAEKWQLKIKKITIDVKEK